MATTATITDLVRSSAKSSATSPALECRILNMAPLFHAGQEDQVNYTCGITAATTADQAAEAACAWRGRHADLLAHVATAHPAHMIRGRAVDVLWRVNLRATNFEVRLLSAFGELFWCIVGAWGEEEVEEDGLVYGHVCYVGDKDNAAKYRYKMEVWDKRGEREMVVSGRTQCLEQRAEANMHRATIGPYVVSGHLRCKFKVSKVSLMSAC